MSGWWGWTWENITRAHWPEWRTGGILSLKRNNLLLLILCMGYWPSVRSRWLDIGQCFFCVFTDQDGVEVHKLAKQRTRPVSSHLDRLSLVNKGFIIRVLGKFSLRDTTGSPEQARQLHLACLGSQSQGRIWFILPAHGASHIINTHPCYYVRVGGVFSI